METGKVALRRLVIFDQQPCCHLDQCQSSVSSIRLIEEQNRCLCHSKTAKAEHSATIPNRVSCADQSQLSVDDPRCMWTADRLTFPDWSSSPAIRVLLTVYDTKVWLYHSCTRSRLKACCWSVLAFFGCLEPAHRGNEDLGDQMGCGYDIGGMLNIAEHPPGGQQERRVPT